MSLHTIFPAQMGTRFVVSASWARFLPEHTTAVALLDRLLHHAVTVVTSGDSYRMKEARTRAGGPTTKA